MEKRGGEDERERTAEELGKEGYKGRGEGRRNESIKLTRKSSLLKYSRNSITFCCVQVLHVK